KSPGEWTVRPHASFETPNTRHKRAVPAFPTRGQRPTLHPSLGKGNSVSLSQSCPRNMPTFPEIKGSDSVFGGRAIRRYLVCRCHLHLRRHSSSSGSVMKLPRRGFLHIAAGASALASLSLPRIAIGQEAYPSRPIHVIVGFTAGAASDVTARILGDSMRPILGQQIIVEDRPGAGSSIAAEYVAHAAKDGYTLFVATLSIITNQIINPNPSFDLTRDLAPVVLLASGAVVL